MNAATTATTVDEADEAPAGAYAEAENERTPAFQMSSYLKAVFSGLLPGEEVELRAVSRDRGTGDGEGDGVAGAGAGVGVGAPKAQTLFSRKGHELVEWAQARMAHSDVYVGAAPRRNRDGRASGVKRLTYLWADLDFKGEHTAQTRVAQMRAMRALPIVVVRTGGGLHLYWRLIEPVEGEMELARAVRLMRAMAVRLGCDNVSDLPRMLRLPGTLNHKYDPPRPVELGWVYGAHGAHGALCYTLEELEEEFGSEGRGPERAGGQELAVGSIDDTQSAMAASRTNPKPALPTGSVLNGVPEGERDVTLFRLACKLRRAGVPQLVAARLVKEAADNCKPPFPWKEALAKVVRVYARYPEGPEERHILRETERERMDPSLRVFAGVGTDQHSVLSPQSSELHEMGGEELVQSALAGGSIDPPSLPFLQQNGYIIEGWSHVLAGYPRCGKTELLVRLCREWLDAGKTIVYFTEESKKVWEHRLARQGGDWSGMRVVFALSGALDRLFARAYGGEENVVVIDTMRNLLQLVDETDNSRIAAVLNPWVAGARLHNKTLIMAHHMRKGGGDHGEGIAGGHALMGVFDIALTLRKEDRSPKRRLVTAYARLLQPPELIYEQDEQGEIQAKGDPASVQLAEVVERVRGVLGERGEEWLKTSEVREGLGEPTPALSQLRNVLMQMARDGVIERDPAIAVNDASGRVIMWRKAPQPHLTP